MLIQHFLPCIQGKKYIPNQSEIQGLFYIRFLAFQCCSIQSKALGVKCIFDIVWICITNRLGNVPQGLILVMGAFNISFIHDISILHFSILSIALFSLYHKICDKLVAQGLISVMGVAPKRPMTPTAARCDNSWTPQTASFACTRKKGKLQMKLFNVLDKELHCAS